MIDFKIHIQNFILYQIHFEIKKNHGNIINMNCNQ
jgi:hypothetical protein